jgi:hypothetical protein
MSQNNLVSKIEEIRLRNLQMGRDILKRDKHYTDTDLNAYFFKIHEDLTLIAHTLKRIISPYSD